MTLLQVLEKTRWSSMVEREGKWVNSVGTNYYVDGRRVAEDYFRKQERRFCLWTKRVSEKSSNSVFCGREGPGCLDRNTTKIVQYVPLPFYRKS
jgi:hypothetical protein